VVVVVVEEEEEVVVVVVEEVLVAVVLTLHKATSNGSGGRRSQLPATARATCISVGSSYYCISVSNCTRVCGAAAALRSICLLGRWGQYCLSMVNLCWTGDVVLVAEPSLPLSHVHENCIYNPQPSQPQS
jgi:hypothetical protein